MNGSLTYKDYLGLIKKKEIISLGYNKDQIQPSSIDLTLSDECYEIKYSFLASNTKVRDKLENLIVKKINLNKKFVFEINKTYLVRLNEKLNLKNNIFGVCNPKSSTGRLDIFCRTIVDYTDEYEKIPLNYKGEVFIEITSRSFRIEFEKGCKLNQLRLIYNKRVYLSDKEIKNLNKINRVIFNNSINNNFNIDNGIKVSIDLSKKNIINAYYAKKNTPILVFKKVGYHKVTDFWIPVKLKENSLIIKKK